MSVYRSSGAAALILVALVGCGGDDDGAAGPDGGAADAGVATEDILTTDLDLDLAALTGHVDLTATPGPDGLRLEVGGLIIDSLTVDGEMQSPVPADGLLTIPAAGSAALTVAIDYRFDARPASGFDGWMPASGVSFLWPTFCHNLFPCVSDPADGARFTMAVSGVADGATAVFPSAIPTDAPSYMPAVAVGDYSEIALGTTPAGTEVSVWHLPGEAAAAGTGTAHLLDVVDFYERTYGAYLFGSKLASVSANWGPGAYGGMEHHPFVHIARNAMDDEETHAHEAAHGWFGDGVRIACWEDFVLSEGTVSYLAAHALEEVGGPNVWPAYVAELTSICDGGAVNTIALPDTCGVVDLINDDLWSTVPYMKGACFFEEVASLLGADVLDGVLADFYQAHGGGAAGMRDLLAAIDETAGAQAAQVDALADEWLYSLACPTDYATRCGH